MPRKLTFPLCPSLGVYLRGAFEHLPDQVVIPGSKVAIQFEGPCVLNRLTCNIGSTAGWLLNPFTATGYFHRQPPRWPTFLAMLFQIRKEGMGLPLSDELRSDQKVTLARHMMAPKLRFSCGLKAKAPGAVTCACSCSRSDVALVEIFTGPQRPSTEHKKQRWWRWGFYFFTFEGLSSVWLLFYQRFDAALLLWSSPYSWLAMFHSRRCSYIHTDDPSTKTGVHCELEHRDLRSLRAVWSIFSHQAPPSPVSSASQSLPPFPSPSLSTRWNQLSPRSPSSRKHSNVQLVPACVASGNIHNAVSRHLDKNRAKHRRTVFFFNEQSPGEQAAINELTKKTPRKHATTTTSVAGLWQMRKNEIEVGRIYTSLATGMVFATYIYVPWQWTG